MDVFLAIFEMETTMNTYEVRILKKIMGLEIL